SADEHDNRSRSARLEAALRPRARHGNGRNVAHIPEKWTPISGLPDIGTLKCANRKHPICVVFRKGYAPTQNLERIWSHQPRTSGGMRFPRIVDISWAA